MAKGKRLPPERRALLMAVAAAITGPASSGTNAAARRYPAGVKFFAGYPNTPSDETLRSAEPCPRSGVPVQKTR